jgi:prepilin-type N-terminal cleavage/methylation domain-containing protein/prepilin-type processing-associated H-X9-DG protein
MKKGFTLIELLVVIVIIAILAALLFPVFSQAKVKGKQADCMSNLKEIGVAVALYESDSDDHFPLGHAPESDPLSSFDGGGDYEPHFIELLRPYIKNRNAEGIWRCKVDPSPRFNKEGDNTEFHVSYAVNGWFEYGQSATSVEQPSAKIHVLESVDDDHAHWWQIGRTSPQDPMLGFAEVVDLNDKRFKEQFAYTRHNGGSQYLFADQHTKWARLEQVWGKTRDTNALWP